VSAQLKFRTFRRNPPNTSSGKKLLSQTTGSAPTQFCSVPLGHRTAATLNCKPNDPQFSMAGASVTNNLQFGWRATANVLEPMTPRRPLHQVFDSLWWRGIPAVTKTPPYQRGAAPGAAAWKPAVPLLGPGRLD